MQHPSLRRPLAAAVIAASGFALAWSAQTWAEDATTAKPQVVELITLGTIAGPPPTVDRTQNSQMLVVGGTPYLIDAGENVTRRIKQAGLDLKKVKTLFITHPHGDHTHGLPALLSTQWYYGANSMAIYGPPGTAELTNAAIDFIDIDTRIRQADEASSPVDLHALFKVTDVGTGQVYKDGNITVSAVENSHFQFPKGSPLIGKYKSYSYRFVTSDGRTIVFTGDTGVTEDVTRLAKGADVLVAECLALDEIRARREKTGTWQAMSKEQQEGWYHHMQKEHITPEQAGELARDAGVGMLVLTHISSGGVVGDDYIRYAQDAARHFHGLIVVAHDGMKFDVRKANGI
ncbi:MAG TPA: MBL fold metallo-hydrolase [Nevskiaceae bacterium]